MLPIVLHHGLFGFADLGLGPVRIHYFRGIDKALADRGHPLLVSRVHPTGSIELRARQLKENILRGLKSIDASRKKVFIIAHSMGGLDARYMMSKLGMDDQVAALMTISTPHRGSPYADWCIENLGKKLGGLKLMKFLGLDVEAIHDLTIERCKRFNRIIKNVPGVQYYSISAARPWNRVPPFALHPFRVIEAAEGENDCLVSVKSAIWGEHLGTWPADHFHVVNHRLVLEITKPTGSILPLWMKAIDQVISRLA